MSIAATLDQIRATANLSLTPDGDLILDPSGNDVLPNLGYDINLGMLTKKYLTVHAAELWVETLVAQNTLATIGGRVLVGPTNILAVDAAVGDTSLSFKYNNFANGDVIYFEANGFVEFMRVTSGASGGGPYAYTVVRDLDGSGANPWYAGDAAFDTGVAGNGFIDLYSIHGVKAGTEYGPTIVGNVRNSTTFNDWTPRWAVGNLNGLYGYSTNIYGAAFGIPTGAWVKIDPTNGVRIGYNTTTFAQVTASGSASFTGMITVSGLGPVTPSSAGLYLGSNYMGYWNGSAWKTYLDSSGNLVATLQGVIGAFTLNTHLYTGSKTAYNDANAGVHIGSDGIGLRGTSNFQVSSAGALSCNNASFAGGVVVIDANGVTLTAGTSGINEVKWTDNSYIQSDSGVIGMHSYTNYVWIGAGSATLKFYSNKDLYCIGGGGSIGVTGAYWQDLYVNYGHVNNDLYVNGQLHMDNPNTTTSGDQPVVYSTSNKQFYRRTDALASFNGTVAGITVVGGIITAAW